jgi:hypothetical protein
MTFGRVSFGSISIREKSYDVEPPSGFVGSLDDDVDLAEVDTC